MTYSPDPLKDAAVAGFINVNFPAPGYEVTGTYESERSMCLFRIRSHGTLVHQFGVSREFLDDHALVSGDRVDTPVK